jgi:hypothetical protein
VESEIINIINIVDQQSDVVIVFLGCFVHVHVNVLVSTYRYSRTCNGRKKFVK